MERAVVEGALEAARKDNSRLQSEVATLRSALRRGVAIEETIAPAEPANDEGTLKSKAVGDDADSIVETEKSAKA
jgi:hypothetical protein